MAATSGVDYKIAIGLTGEQLFDILSRQVAETTKALSGVTAELGKVNTSLSGAGGAARSFGGEMNSASHEAEGGISMLTGKLGELAAAVGIAFSIEKVVEWGKSILDVTAEMQGYENRIKFASEGDEEAAKNINYINDAVVRLHLPMRESMEQFSALEASMKGTALQGKGVTNIFEGMGEASSVMHLNPARFQEAALAIQEMGSEGHVYTRQMVRQLGIAIPGAVEIGARAMKMSMAQFYEAMDNGMLSTDFLPKFAEELKKTYGPSLARSADSLMSSINDTNNAIYIEQLKVGKKLEGFYKGIMEDMRDVINTIGAETIHAIDWVNAHFSDVQKDMHQMWVSMANSLKGINIHTYLQSMGNEFSAFVHEVWNGMKPFIEAVWQFKDQFMAVFGVVWKGIETYIHYLGKYWRWIWTIMADIIDVMHTVYVFFEKIGVIELVVDVFKGLYKAVSMVGDSLRWIYDHSIGPIVDAIHWAYKEIKGILGIPDTELTVTHNHGAGGSWEEHLTPDKTPPIDKVLGDQRTNISAAAEGNKVRNVIITIEKMIGVENMSYDQHTHDPKHIERAISNMLVDSTRDAEIALGRN